MGAMCACEDTEPGKTPSTWGGDPGAFERMRYGHSDWVAEPADVGPFMEGVIGDLINQIKPVLKVSKRKRSPDAPDHQEASTPRQPEGQSSETGPIR